MTKLTANIFNSSIEKPRFTALDIRRPLLDGTSFKVYPISQLHTLIQTVQTKASPIRKIRYLVDMSDQLWFAEEGGACRTIPAHYQMGDTQWCVAAGNIKFSEDYQQIELINHKSSYKPTLDSIKWVIAILIANEALLNELSIRLPATLIVNKLTSSGGNDEAHVLETAELKQWINNTFGEDKLSLFKKQPITIKETTYTAPAPVYSPFQRFFDDNPRGSTATAPSTIDPMDRSRFLALFLDEKLDEKEPTAKRLKF